MIQFVKSFSPTTSFKTNLPYSHRTEFISYEKHHEKKKPKIGEKVQRQNIQSQINSRFTPVSDIKKEYFFYFQTSQYKNLSQKS